MSESTADIVILGGGMVGLSLAHQLNERHPELSIAVIDKEPQLGRHSSGRNSGVLQLGFITHLEHLRLRFAWREHVDCALGARRRTCRCWHAER